MSSLSWLWNNVRFMRWRFVLALSLILLDMVSLLGITGVQKWLIDDVFMEGRYDSLPRLLIIFAILIIGYNGIHLVSFLLNRANELTLQKKFSVQMMKYVYAMPVKKYHNERIAGMANRLAADIAETSGTAAHVIPNGISNVIKVFILAGFIGWASPIILLFIVLLSLVYILMGKYFAPRLKSAAKQVSESRSDVFVQIEEGISSTREVVAYHRGEWEMRKYNRYFNLFLQQSLKEGKLENKQLFWSEPFRWGGNLTVLGYGAYLTINHSISIGTFVVVYQFASQLLESLQGVFNFAMGLSSRTANLDRIRDFMTEEEPQGGKVMDTPINQIRFEQVWFKYSEQSDFILKGLSLHIHKGQKVAFVGSSGGGKSTVAQLLTRFYEVSDGKIMINEVSPLNDIAVLSWRDRVKMVFQEPYLFPDTIRNNLLMGRPLSSEQEMVAACITAEIHEYIVSLPNGYDSEVGERGITLSGGQRQRIALARALIEDPEILILDEATSALDLETERQVQRNVDRIRHGKTTIVIAHRLSTIQNADTIYVLDQGKVAAAGTHDELMKTSTVYSRLVLSQDDDSMNERER
ncbi:ABC transporter ATP-binding protein [Paenibacillus mendelii]|uniref:ABC transporter ATP-binding protein n=1 Tax=Paenibacillus mendelii TaxID=206163 RepID=A0ABV6JB35_9BACL|nr:ABC transporter ATP-binding protein [Paenibacillus mendelii]MCQ6562969.1 ABC transporter ATP-binding protein/permease [Paenibacillus mendelii]